jgi:hypothetical protein
MTLRSLSAAIAVALASACTRSVPSEFPARSAASPGAEQAPARVLARAIREEPPLPGEAMDGWEALGDPADESSHGEHHHHAH